MLPFPALGHVIVPYASPLARLPTENNGDAAPPSATLSFLARPSYRPSHSLTGQIHNQDVEQPPVGIFFGDDPMPVIEEAEALCQREGVLCERCRFLGNDDLIRMPLAHRQERFGTIRKRLRPWIR
jgi:hypothetical protein